MGNIFCSSLLESIWKLVGCLIFMTKASEIRRSFGEKIKIIFITSSKRVIITILLNNNLINLIKY